MSKTNPTITPFGKIPGDIWHNQKWFIGKLQIPLGGTAMTEALIYDETKDWQLFVPLDWIKDVKMGNEPKKYFWMWFDKDHALNIESEVKEYQYW